MTSLWRNSARRNSAKRRSRSQGVGGQLAIERLEQRHLLAAQADVVFVVDHTGSSDSSVGALTFPWLQSGRVGRRSAGDPPRPEKVSGTLFGKVDLKCS